MDGLMLLWGLLAPLRVDFVAQVLEAGGSEAVEEEDAKAAVAALSDA